jgi:hypothetical protein
MGRETNERKSQQEFGLGRESSFHPSRKRRPNPRSHLNRPRLGTSSLVGETYQLAQPGTPKPIHLH